MRLRFRQETGEITPAAWMGGAFGFVTFASFAFFASPWIGMLAALILTSVFALIAVLCFFAAGKQHYINVGRGQATASAHIPVPVAHAVATAVPQKKPAKIEIVGTESNVDLSVFDDGVLRWSPNHGGGVELIERGLLIAFRHTGGREVAVNAHLTFVSSSGKKVWVNYGFWLGNSTRTAIFYPGDTKELVVASASRRRHVCATFEDAAREDASWSGAVSRKTLVDGEHDLRVGLDVIDEQSGEVVSKPFDFKIFLDATNPDLCFIEKL